MTLAAVLAGTQPWHVEVAHVLAGLRALPDGCVQCVVTSPPYWGLRAYSTAPQVWSGAAACAHAWAPTHDRLEQGNKRKPSDDGIAGRDRSTDKAVPVLLARTHGTCTRCGAWRGELGSEPTVQLFVAHLVAVLAAVRRVLRDDGTVWLNIADSYSGSGKGPTGATSMLNGGKGVGDSEKVVRRTQELRQGFADHLSQPDGIPAKSLCLIPERLALALSEDGWIIRSHIVWAKLAPMPESVTDRPTSAWEHVWLLTKRGRYFYDAEAVRQPNSGGVPYGDCNGDKPLAAEGWGQGRQGQTSALGPLSHAERVRYATNGANLRNVWTLPPEPYDAEYCTACGGYFEGVAKSAIRTRVIDSERRRLCPCGRWDAWLSHFATFPSEIPRRAVLAGTSAYGACPSCGAGWRRPGERTPQDRTPLKTPKHEAMIATRPRDQYDKGRGSHLPGWRAMVPDAVELGHWQPTCTCPNAADVVPCLMLDPFSGSGTSILVAHQLGRRAIGIELSAPYAAMSRARISQDAPLLEAVAAADVWAQGALF